MKLIVLVGVLFFVEVSEGQLWNYNYRSCSYCWFLAFYFSGLYKLSGNENNNVLLGYPYGGYGGYGGYNGYRNYGYNYLSPLTSGYQYGYNPALGYGSLGGMCRDRSPNCAYLVAMGECATNPIATRSMCPISCGTGCQGLGTTVGLGVGTMDALADTSLYTNPLLYNSLSTYGGIYRREPHNKIVERPLEKL